jgi:hypothetical protein
MELLERDISQFNGVARIIITPKPGKPLEEANSYRLTSLLPIMSEIFEKGYAP